MKKIGTLCLALCLLCAACAKEAAGEETQAPDSSAYALSSERAEQPNGSEAQPDLYDYLDRCDAAVRAEVLAIEELNRFNVCFTCRVLEDFFGNLNDKGMEPGQISIYMAGNDYQVGDDAYFFLMSSENIIYPHIVYTPLSGQGAFVCTKNTQDGIVPVRSDQTLTGNAVYGLPEEVDLSEAIRQYARENPKETLNNMLPEISSYEEMVELSTEIWLIRMDSCYQEDDDIKYMQHFTCKILDVYRSETGLEAGEYARGILPVTKELERGATYLFFKGIRREIITSPLSEEYCLLKEGDPQFDEITALLERERAG